VFPALLEKAFARLILLFHEKVVHDPNLDVLV
jgi:hypothetical protein